MEKVLLFDRPLSCELLSNGEDEFEIWSPIYGMVLPEVDYTFYNLSDYVAYLCAAQKWCDLGGDVNFHVWKKDDTNYNVFDEEIQKFIDNAIKEQPICADIFEVDIDLNGGIIHTFLVDADMVQRIKEEGKLVDVLKAPYEEEGQGV